MISPTKPSNRNTESTPKTTSLCSAQREAKWTKSSEDGIIDDSDDSPLSETESLNEGPSNTLDTNPIQLPESHEEALLEEEIIRTAVEFTKKHRHRRMPGHFEKHGRLLPQWRCLKGRILEARKAYKSMNKQESNNKEPHLNTVTFNTHNHQMETDSQTRTDNRSIRVYNRRQPPVDTAGISCDQCRIKQQKCEHIVDSNLVKLNCLSCAKDGETCSLSTGRKLRAAKIDSSADCSARTVIKGSQMHSRDSKQTPETSTRIRRPSRASKPEDTKIPATTQSCLSLDESRLSKANTSKVDPASHLPCTSIVCTDGPERDHQVITSNPSEGQRQPSRPSNTCDICHNVICSCNPDEPEDILCNGETCSKKRFTNSYLEKHIGIQLSDAYDTWRHYGFWRCPECSHKKALLDSRRPNASTATFIPPKFGQGSLDDEVVRSYLNQFSGLVLNHISMASKSALPPEMRMQSLLQIPCITEELLDESYGVNHPLVDILRQILGVPSGILLKDMVLRYQLHNLNPTIWTRVVLVFMFYQFVFETKPLFDEVDIWRKALIHSMYLQIDFLKSANIATGIPPAFVEMEIQDIRIRTMDEEPASYKERLKDQHQKHVTRLNAVMMPLIGGNADFHKIHEKIAKIASDLNAKLSAYTGTYTEIMPRIGERMDPDMHESDDQEDKDKDNSDRYIQLTSMLGIKFQSPGRPCRICSPAKVRLWATSVPELDSSGSSINSALESSNHGIVPRKRTCHDLMSP